MPTVCPEGCLGDVIRMHAHLVVPAAKVDLGEEAGTLQLIQELIDHRDRVLVLDGGVVEGSVVDAETPSVVVLADQKHRGGEW